MRRRLLTLAAAALLAGAPRAARAESPPPEPRNEISVGWAPHALLRRDQIASPLLYAGPALGAGLLRYARTRGANAHRLDLGIMAATLKSQPDFGYLRWPDGAAATTSGSPLTYVRLKYAYLRALPTPDRVAVRLGPGLDFDIQQLEWVHAPSSLGGYFGAFALDARLEVELRLAPRQRLTATLALPAFAWVTRSPYALNDDAQIYANRDHNGLRTFFRYLADGEIETWNRYQALRLDLRYDLRFARHWAFSPGVHARILANQSPRPVVAQDYGVSLAITALF